MPINLLKDKGVPIDQQRFTWKELVQAPYSMLDDDAFTRVRVILMNGIESEALRFQHACARMNRDLQLSLARVRRLEQHQQTMVNWLNPADQSPLETTIGFEQVAIEVTASVAQSEPDPYLAQVYRFGLTVAKAVKREKPTLFVDKLGARIAFERTGVRLYDALLSKFDSLGGFEGGPARAELVEIRNDELSHFHMLREAMESLGGDPTALTPAANVEAVLSSGVPKILTDARSTLAECLEAVLTAELVDTSAGKP